MENKDNQMENSLYKAELSRCVAQRDEAIAHLETLYNRSVGIGEHTDILEEIDKWTEKLAAAIDKIQVTATVFGQNPKDEGAVSPKVPQESVTASSQGAM